MNVRCLEPHLRGVETGLRGLGFGQFPGLPTLGTQFQLSRYFATRYYNKTTWQENQLYKVVGASWFRL